MTTIDSTKPRPGRCSPVPWWAAFGAPLVGVPLLIAVLALGSPEPTVEVAPEVDGTYLIEQVEPPVEPDVQWTAEAAPLPELPGGPASC